MDTFKLDTSGRVATERANDVRKHPAERYVIWPDLSPFVQGYIEAAYDLADFERGGDPPGFADLAPETLARIMEDADRYRRPELDYTREEGESFWIWQAEGFGDTEDFPPLALYLGDDGKVRIREAGR